MSFVYSDSSLIAHFEAVTGTKFVLGNSHKDKLDRCPMVSLEGNERLTNDAHEVRDWCEEQFGLNWAYRWNDYYFKHQKDADWFALRWL